MSNHVRQDAEDAVQVDAPGGAQTVAEQVQAQIGVRHVGRRGVQVDPGEQGRSVTRRSASSVWADSSDAEACEPSYWPR